MHALEFIYEDTGVELDGYDLEAKLEHLALWGSGLGQARQFTTADACSSCSASGNVMTCFGETLLPMGKLDTDGWIVGQTTVCHTPGVEAPARSTRLES